MRERDLELTKVRNERSISGDSRPEGFPCVPSDRSPACVHPSTLSCGIINKKEKQPKCDKVEPKPAVRIRTIDPRNIAASRRRARKNRRIRETEP